MLINFAISTLLLLGAWLIKILFLFIFSFTLYAQSDREGTHRKEENKIIHGEPFDADEVIDPYGLYLLNEVLIFLKSSPNLKDAEIISLVLYYTFLLGQSNKSYQNVIMPVTYIEIANQINEEILSRTSKLGISEKKDYLKVPNLNEPAKLISIFPCSSLKPIIMSNVLYSYYFTDYKALSGNLLDNRIAVMYIEHTMGRIQALISSVSYKEIDEETGENVALQIVYFAADGAFSSMKIGAVDMYAMKKFGPKVFVSSVISRMNNFLSKDKAIKWFL